MVQSLWTQSISRAMGFEPGEVDALDLPCALRWDGERASEPAPLQVTYGDDGAVTRVLATDAFEGSVPPGLYRYTHADAEVLLEVDFCANGTESCEDSERITMRVATRGEDALWLRRTSWDAGEVSTVFDQVVSFGGDDPQVMRSSAAMTFDGDAPADRPMDLSEPEPMRWDEGWRMPEVEGIERDDSGRVTRVSWGAPSMRTVKTYTYGERGEVSSIAMTRNDAPLKSWSYAYSDERPGRITRITNGDGAVLLPDYACHD